jgi:hypothetical protein
MLTKDEVIWGFRYCLGRDPESEEVVEAHRNFRDWRELREILLDCPELAEEEAEAAETDVGLVFEDDRLVLSPDDLGYPDPYAGDGAQAICRNGVIEYDDRQRAVDEPVLFFGPYISLDPAIYLFRFIGDLRGVLRVRFTHQSGTPIKEVTIDNFREPLCLVLSREVTEFEVVGEKTPSLTALRIDSIVIDRVAVERSAEAPRA